MPSIPQSLLWISLVVLWLFVLVPMLISKRDAVRRTSDVALATRVLNGGRAQRLRRGPAAGHNSDPHWQPAEDELDEKFDHLVEEPERSVVVAAAVAETPEPDYLDVDIVEEDSGALPVGTAMADAEPETDQLALNLEEPEAEDVSEPEPVDEPQPEAEAVQDEAAEEEPDGTADEYEYVDDSSGLEPESADESDDDQAEAPVTSLSASRQRRFESKTAAAVSARKYKFRKRVLAVFAIILVGSAAAAFLLNPAAWWVCGTAATLTVLYLAYLRRQTRIEEQLRRRRAQRMMRSRLGVESTDDHKLDVVPSRLRRPGSVVLEIDDEDPIFEHLDYAPFAREYDLPRASGQ
ncbi:divisome protein SepX/GlpR [Mycolicibacterium mageritense]|uniref:divisome protein SepX/GlpR n=1 Tax=Mycolicibacterium mageritense TaxID=53462 RepID=UPI001E589919|nr:gephyrin-like molybdotransferase receptor GlpR [Mycolicibacterium mageritense]GJJ22693.1 membrane protein [Mycolicibacterium mageritense]